MTELLNDRFEIVRELGGKGVMEKGRTAAQDIVQAVPDIDGIFELFDHGVK